VWSFVVLFLSCRGLWSCSCRVVCCVVLVLCVCDLFLFLHPPVHTLLFTPFNSHPSLHRGGAGGASPRNALSCSHLPVHTLLFTPFYSQGWRGRSVFTQRALLFTPSCSHPPVQTLPFTGVARAERLHATLSLVHTFLFTPSCSHPSIHRGGAGGNETRALLSSCPHPPVHTLPFTGAARAERLHARHALSAAKLEAVGREKEDSALDGCTFAPRLCAWCVVYPSIYVYTCIYLYQYIII